LDLDAIDAAPRTLSKTGHPIRFVSSTVIALRAVEGELLLQDVVSNAIGARYSFDGITRSTESTAKLGWLCLTTVEFSSRAPSHAFGCATSPNSVGCARWKFPSGFLGLASTGQGGHR
jgi:hypothetical protein